MRRAILLVLMALSLWPQRAQASFGNCTNAAYVDGFDERLIEGPCEQIGPLLDVSGPGGPAQVRVITREGAALPRRADIAALVADAVTAARAAMAAMGTVATHDVSVWLTTTPPPAGHPIFTRAIARPGSSECHVTVYDAAATTGLPGEFRHLLAHEIFHCVQFRMWPGASSTGSAAWWVEGSAEYFANLALPGTIYSDAYISGFEHARERSLTSHSYNAVVFFFWYGQSRGATALPSLLAALPTSGGGSIQNAALRSVLPLTGWMEFEEAYLDHAISKPGGAAFPVSPAPGPATSISASYTLSLSADMFSISAARLHFAQGHVYQIDRSGQPPSMAVHWTQASRGGWADPPATINTCDAPADYRQAVGAVDFPTSMTVQISVSDAGDRACCPETTRASSGFVLAAVECPSPEPGDAGDGGGRSFGEPHLLTFDRHAFSFQMAGEFVLTRGGDGFEVQTRQERLPGQEVSANTAVALRIGGNRRIAVYARAFSGVPTDTSNLYIDGKPVAVTEAGLDAGSAVIRARGAHGYDIVLRSGYRVFIDFFDWNGFRYLDVEVRVPKSRRGALVGLLGNYDGRPANDLRSRDGRLIAANNAAYERFKGPLSQFIPGGLPLEPLIASYFNELYRTFGNSWRIQQSESLFDYGAGQSTATFTQAAFPGRILTLASVDPRVVDDAQRVCAAANVPPGTMNGCVFDVAMTGNNGFADALRQIGEQLKQRGLDELIQRVPGVPGVPDIPNVPGLPDVPRIPGL